MLLYSAQTETACYRFKRRGNVFFLETQCEQSGPSRNITDYVLLKDIVPTTMKSTIQTF